MKTILIPIYAAPTALRLLLSDALRVIRERADTCVVLVVRSEKRAFYEQAYGGPNVAVETLDLAPSRAHEAFLFFTRFATPTHSLDLYRRELRRNGDYLRYAAAVFMGWIGSSHATQRLLRWIESSFPIPRAVDELLDRARPDLVVAPTLVVANELAVAKAAKQRRIPTLGIVKSWDTFTTKGAILFFPDRLFVYNEMNRAEAVHYFGYPNAHIRIIGFPQFDIYHRADMRTTRDEFCRRAGLDPQKKIILYGPAGDWMTPDDVPVLKQVAAWVAAGEFGPATLLVRQNPGCASATEGVALTLPGVVHERPGHAVGRSGQWEFDLEDVKHLLNTLLHADVNINWASTLTLESSLLDRPIVWPAYDGDRKLLEADSVYQMYRREHMLPLAEAGVAEPARNPEALKAAIHEALEHPEKRASGRARVRHWIDPHEDGRAGERVGREILNALDELPQKKV